jgi:hypothetical protein
MSKKALTNKKDHPKREDHLRVMLALSNDDISDTGPCPDPNDMAAFIDGTIERKKNEKIVAHLNTCHDCYNDWLMVSSAVAEPEKSSVFNELKLVFTNTVNRFSMSKPVFTYVFAAAAAVCLVLVFWAVNGSNLDDLINNSYTSNIMAGISQDDLEFNNIYKLPWERSKTTYGFAPQPTDSDTSRAFGAGLWSARKEVLGDQVFPTKPAFVEAKQAWQTSPKEIYFWLGRWSYLLRAMCMSDQKVSQDFWGKQLEISNKVQKKVSASYNKNNEVLKMVTLRLDNIKSILNKSAEGTLNRESRRDIAAELDFLINFLSPRNSKQG